MSVIYTFSYVDFSFFPGLGIYLPLSATVEKVNCLTDVNWFSKLFYILPEETRVDLERVIDLSTDKFTWK